MTKGRSQRLLRAAFRFGRRPPASRRPCISDPYACAGGAARQRFRGMVAAL